LAAHFPKHSETFPPVGGTLSEAFGNLPASWREAFDIAKILEA
jgi:hypothetical protein